MYSYIRLPFTVIKNTYFLNTYKNKIKMKRQKKKKSHSLDNKNFSATPLWVFQISQFQLT